MNTDFRFPGRLEILVKAMEEYEVCEFYQEIKRTINTFPCDLVKLDDLFMRYENVYLHVNNSSRRLETVQN